MQVEQRLDQEGVVLGETLREGPHSLPPGAEQDPPVSVVQLTRDGYLVAFHDNDLFRTCGTKGRINEMTWQEVSRARVDGKEPIPLLSDLLEEFPEAFLNIDSNNNVFLSTGVLPSPRSCACTLHTALDCARGALGGVQSWVKS